MGLRARLPRLPWLPLLPLLQIAPAADTCASDASPKANGRVLLQKEAFAGEIAAVAEDAPGYDHPPWLSQCREIYLDVGSNLGVQVRKFFEPEKYPDSTFLTLFEESFGPAEARRRPQGAGLCALGFEQNPAQRPRLQKLQEGYAKRGWRVHFYPFAVWKNEGLLSFNVTENPEYADWDARLALAQERTRWKLVNVRTVDLSAFVQHELPKGTVKLMKMDIEGAEYETLAKMLSDKTLCADTIPKIVIEAHAWGDTSTWQSQRTFEAVQARVAGQDVCTERGGPTVMANVDDESYLLDVDNDFAGSTA